MLHAPRSVIFPTSSLSAVTSLVARFTGARHRPQTGEASSRFQPVPFATSDGVVMAGVNTSGRLPFTQRGARKSNRQGRSIDESRRSLRFKTSDAAVKCKHLDLVPRAGRVVPTTRRPRRPYIRVGVGFVVNHGSFAFHVGGIIAENTIDSLAKEVDTPSAYPRPDRSQQDPEVTALPVSTVIKRGRSSRAPR
jgi:hypothetical protein